MRRIEIEDDIPGLSYVSETVHDPDDVTNATWQKLTDEFSIRGVSINDVINNSTLKYMTWPENIGIGTQDDLRQVAAVELFNTYAAIQSNTCPDFDKYRQMVLKDPNNLRPSSGQIDGFNIFWGYVNLQMDRAVYGFFEKAIGRYGTIDPIKRAGHHETTVFIDYDPSPARISSSPEEQRDSHTLRSLERNLRINLTGFEDTDADFLRKALYEATLEALKERNYRGGGRTQETIIREQEIIKLVYIENVPPPRAFELLKEKNPEVFSAWNTFRHLVSRMPTILEKVRPVIIEKFAAKVQRIHFTPT